MYPMDSRNHFHQYQGLREAFKNTDSLTPRLHTRPTELDFLEVRPRNIHFNTFPDVLDAYQSLRTITSLEQKSLRCVSCPV